MPALRKSVELVENDDTIRELIAMVLLRAGYAVRSVTDGAEAVRACLGNVPDLVISDVHMPRMDGFEFVEALRKNAATETVPVIFLTVDDSGVAHGEKLGAAAFLTKPILADRLLAAVSKALEPARKCCGDGLPLLRGLEGLLLTKTRWPMRKRLALQRTAPDLDLAGLSDRKSIPCNTRFRLDGNLSLETPQAASFLLAIDASSSVRNGREPNVGRQRGRPEPFAPITLFDRD